MLIVGCGGSTGSPTTSASGSPVPAPRPARQSALHLTIANDAGAGSHAASGQSAHAQFVAFARAVNLRAQDVPGFRLAPPDRGGKVRVHNKAFEDSSAYGRCVRIGKQEHPLVKRTSGKLMSPTTFSRSTGPRFEQVSSRVEVARSLATSRKELREGERALASATSRRCLSRVFDALGSQNQVIHFPGGTMRVTVGNLRMTPVSVAAATRGTDGGFGFSMTLAVTYRVKAHGRAVTFPTSLGIDVIGFVVGRATVMLTTMAMGSSFPPGLEASSFAELVSRASAAARRYPDVLR